MQRKDREEKKTKKSSDHRSRTAGLSYRSALVVLGKMGRLNLSRGRTAVEEESLNGQSLQDCCRGREQHLDCFP